LIIPDLKEPTINLEIKNNTYNVDNSNIRGGMKYLPTLLLIEIELFQLPATDIDSDIR
jgi:hypothetical protein